MMNQGTVRLTVHSCLCTPSYQMTGSDETGHIHFFINNLTRILLDIERHHFIKFFFVALQEDRPIFGA